MTDDEARVKCADCERLTADLAVFHAAGDDDLMLVTEDDLAQHRQEQHREPEP